ncbi:MAG: protein kinase [Polyangiaceae bacterium]
MTALDNADELVGRHIGGRYRLVSRIGVGAMATIYRATAVATGEAVAVKVVRPEVGRNPTVSARFQREVKAASKLDHPGIVRVLDWGIEEPDTPWLAMELIEGEDLFEILDRCGPLPESWSVAVAAKVCEALDAAHREGVIHRDLKPENVMIARSMVGGERVVKVLDFGVAKLLRPNPMDLFSDETVPQMLTKAGSAVGTPSHMAPEQARGEAVDGRTDIYALGVLLYEMVAGQLPFAGDNPLLVAVQQVRDEPPPPSRFRSDLHPALEALILQMLAKSPADRPQSALELRDRLVHLLQSLAEEDGPTVRHALADSVIAAISDPTTQLTGVTRISMVGDKDDDEASTKVVHDVGAFDDGPATNVVYDADGPSTAVIHELPDDEPPTHLVAVDPAADDGPTTRIVEDDDGPATRLVASTSRPQIARGAAGASPHGLDDDGPATRLVTGHGEAATRIAPAAAGDEDGPTLRASLEEDDDYDDFADELTSLDRRPKIPRPMARSVNAPNSLPERPLPRRQTATGDDGVATRIEGVSGRAPFDSEAPVATVVAEVSPLVSAPRPLMPSASNPKTSPLPMISPSIESGESKRPGAYAQFRRRAALYDIDDADSDDGEPIATKVADPNALIASARRSAEVARGTSPPGSGTRPPPVATLQSERDGPGPQILPVRPEPRVLMPTTDLEDELPPPPPPSTPGMSHHAPMSQGPSSMGPKSTMPMTAFPDGPPPTVDDYLMHPPPEMRSMEVAPDGRDYAAELQDMLMQMPAPKSRPILSTLLVLLVVGAALVGLAWVMYY